MEKYLKRKLRYGILKNFSYLLQHCDHDHLGHDDGYFHYFLDREHDLGDGDDQRDHDLRRDHGLRGDDRPLNFQYRWWWWQEEQLGFRVWPKGQPKK